VVTSQAVERLVALLRIIERPGGDVLTDDALLDAWSGVQSEAFCADEY
jgi:hypothetical protein